MKERILTTCVILPIFLAIMLSKNNIVVFCFVSLMSILGLREYYKSFNIFKDGYYYIGMVLSLIFNVLIKYFDNSIFIPFILVSSFIILTYALLNYNEHSLIKAAITILGLLYIPFLFSFVWLIYSISNIGNLLVWFIFVIAWSTDTCACLIGSYIGKRRITPILSPKKSLEGFVGGTLCTTLITFLLGYALIKLGMLSSNNFLLISFALGFVGSIVSQIGDLTASAIKRLNEIKDFGVIFPGHGGILDRFDSVLFVAPCVYLIIQLFNII